MTEVRRFIAKDPCCRREVMGGRARGLRALLVLAVLATVLPAAVAAAEQSSQPASPAAGMIDAGVHHTCALLVGGRVRCWGFGAQGQLGYGDPGAIGDNETPGSTGPVNVGSGRSAKAISAGDYHTCALLDDGSVRCWGFGADGRLGYGNESNVGDEQTPDGAGPVDLGVGRTAKAISAGGAHTCALLDDGSVRCWGFGGFGSLGYGNPPRAIGDNETPGSAGPVELEPGRKAVAISAGQNHTCALLDDGSVRCWGLGADGRLGYGNESNVGDDQTPKGAGPVSLGAGRTATAISAGGAHTCALLDDGSVRCWGFGGYGELGYGNQSTIGDSEKPGSVGPVNLGSVHKAVAISAGQNHTCALLDDGAVRCWGIGGYGQLGYASTSDIGDDETPGAVGPVDLGLGRSAVAISAGGRHTCARLDDGSVRCWGYGGNGRLGYCNETNVGDDETPGSAGPVELETPRPDCADTNNGGGGGAGTPPPATGAPGAPALVPSVPAPVPVVRPARGVGAIRKLRARAVSKTKIKLSFLPAAANGRPARAYVVTQSRRRIRTKRDFARAQTLCKGRCRFAVPSLATKIILTITDLRPRTTYYYAIQARDNTSTRLGPRSKTVKARTRR